MFNLTLTAEATFTRQSASEYASEIAKTNAEEAMRNHAATSDAYMRAFWLRQYSFWTRFAKRMGS